MKNFTTLLVLAVVALQATASAQTRLQWTNLPSSPEKASVPTAQSSQNPATNSLLAPAQRSTVVNGWLGGPFASQSPCTYGFSGSTNFWIGAPWVRMVGNAGPVINLSPVTNADVVAPFSHFAWLPNPPIWAGLATWAAGTSTFTAALPPWNGPIDPVVANSLGKPITVPFKPGSPVLRLGNSFSIGYENGVTVGGTTPAGSQGAEAVAVPFTVTPGMKTFSFSYAIVCQDPSGHFGYGEKPRFIFQLLSPTNSVVNSIERSADSTNSFWNVLSTSQGVLNWRQVSCYSVDVSAYQGQTLVALFVNTDCALGAHFGYTYIGNFCDPALETPSMLGLKPTYCPNDPIVIDPRQSVGVTKYSLTVSQLMKSPLGQEIAVPGTVRTQTVSPSNLQLPNLIDVKAWYLAAGGNWVCGRKYAITLTIDTECTQNKKVTQTFELSCCDGLECCGVDEVTFDKSAKLRLATNTGNLAFGTTISWGGTAKAIDLTIMNVVRAQAPGYSQFPVYGYFGAVPALVSTPAMAAVTPALTYPRIARWVGSATGTGALLSFNLRVPPLTTPHYIKFTLKAARLDAACKTCITMKTFYFKMEGSGFSEQIDAKDWPRERILPGDTTPDAVVAFQKRANELPATTAGGGPGLSPIDTSMRIYPPLPPGPTPPCCPIRVAPAATDLRPLGNMTSGQFAFAPVLSMPGTWAQVEASMVNAAAAAPNGGTYSILGYIGQVQAAAGFTSSKLVALPFSHGAQWNAAPPGSLVPATSFPMTVCFPPPPASGPVFIHFTMRYSFTNRECQQCDLFIKYYFRIERGKPPVPVDPKKWPIKTETDTGNGGGGTLKRGGGG